MDASVGGKWLLKIDESFREKALGILRRHADEEDITTSAQLAKKYRASAYDILYAVIAKKHNAILVTADANFRKKTGFPFVKLLGEIDLQK